MCFVCCICFQIYISQYKSIFYIIYWIKTRTGYSNTIAMQSNQANIWKVDILANSFRYWMYTWIKKGLSVKNQLPNIFKGHYLIAKSGPTAKVYDQWTLSNAIWVKIKSIFSNILMPAKFYNASCHKCSWYFMTTTDLLVRTIYLLYVSFHVRIMLHHLVILLPHDDGFNKVKNSLKVLKVHITFYYL